MHVFMILLIFVSIKPCPCEVHPDFSIFSGLCRFLSTFSVKLQLRAFLFLFCLETPCNIKKNFAPQLCVHFENRFVQQMVLVNDWVLALFKLESTWNGWILNVWQDNANSLVESLLFEDCQCILIGKSSHRLWSDDNKIQETFLAGSNWCYIQYQTSHSHILPFFYTASCLWNDFSILAPQGRFFSL